MQLPRRCRDGTGGFSLSEGPASPGQKPIGGDAMIEDQVGQPLDAKDAPGMVRRLLGEVPAVDAQVAANSPLRQAPGHSQVVVYLEPSVSDCFCHSSITVLCQLHCLYACIPFPN